MTGARCPKCNGSGRVLSHLNPHDVHNVGAGMGMHRCDRCAGQGVVHGGPASAGGFGSSGGGSLSEQLRRLVIWIFAIFFALVLGNAPPFGLNWAISALIGLVLGSIVGGLLLAFRIGRYILWALGVGFVVAVIVGVIIDKS